MQSNSWFHSPGREKGKGFSLLEMLVAISILGMALGMLYQASGSSVRNVQVDERHVYAVELARSLLANNLQVPASGVSESGETAGGFAWKVGSEPVRIGASNGSSPLLQAISVEVSWQDGARERRIVLDSVVEAVPD